MTTPRRFATVLLTAALVLVPHAAGGAEGTEPAATPATGEEPVQVTLLTGDRVSVRTVDGELNPHVEPAAGREGITFSTSRFGEHLYVVPSDATALLNSGRLDRRLFDVATLLSFGYDDAHRSDLPLIVQAEGVGKAVPQATITTAGADAQALPAASASGLRQPKTRAAELWAEITTGSAVERTLDAGIGVIWLDGLRQPTLDVSVPQIGAPEAWAVGYTGAGVTVALLDTGIDLTHPDLADNIAATRNFSGEANPDDIVGHGTHVASTIVGSGDASGGRHRGVAPDAMLLNGKVCNRGGCPDSAILAAMQWAADSGARVVNLSLGGADSPDVDPLEAAIDYLSTQYGILFVVAAGNSGPGDGTLSSPASADAALAVGAVDDGDLLADFSSRGPRIGDAALKPEITAPGVAIVAARARNGFIGQPVGDHYASLNGTSMASPHVAGAAAVVAQQHPGWAGSQLKALLVGAAETTNGVGAFAQGAGRVDVAHAVAQDLYSEPAAVSAGRQLWPHDDDAPLTRVVTYHNPGSEPATLALTVNGVGPDGTPAPQGMFTLSAQQVTVPPGGDARLDFSVDTSIPGDDGNYSAWITASAGDILVTTPVAVEKEIESYDLTVVNRDRRGDVTNSYETLLLGLDRQVEEFPYDPDGALTVRLPRGAYHLQSWVSTPRSDAEPETAFLVQPLVDLTNNTTIELDARQSAPAEIRFEHDDIVLRTAMIAYKRQNEILELVSLISFNSLADVTTAQFGPDVARNEMITMFQGAWAIPDAAGGFQRSERVYNLAWFEYGQMMTGISRHVNDRQLAEVRTDYRSIGSGRVALVHAWSRPPGMRPFASFGLRLALPIRRVELYNTDGVEWSGEFVQLALLDPDDPDGAARFEGVLSSNVYDREPGRSYRAQWNAAVLGPVVSDGSSAFFCAGSRERTSERIGDVITVAIPLFSDAAGHTGCASAAASRTTLFRNGELVGESPTQGFGELDVPPELATYRLETDVTPEPQAALSSRITAAWTFTSQRVNGDEPEVLPLLAVRFSPELDRYNRAPADVYYTLPLSIDRQGAVSQLDLPTVEASFDDGITWTPVVVTRRRNDTYAASLRHPTGDGFVSLRASDSDALGNTVEQTIYRAYQLKQR